MIDWLGVTGLGVGGIETEAAILFNGSKWTDLRQEAAYFYAVYGGLGSSNWTKFGIVFIILLNLTYHDKIIQFVVSWAASYLSLFAHLMIHASRQTKQEKKNSKFAQKASQLDSSLHYPNKIHS
jgi:hypothetical protein